MLFDAAVKSGDALNVQRIRRLPSVVLNVYSSSAALREYKLERSSKEYKRGKYHCTIDLLFDWFGLVCFANKNKIVSCHTADSKPVKQEINGTVIFPI